MLKKIGLAMSAATLGLGVLAAAPAARADNGVKAGVLTCWVDSGWGFVFGSSRSMKCNFSPEPGRAEHYTGSIQKYGVDIGYTQGGVMVWGVFAPTSNLAPGALSGTYVGVTASATVGVGAGAHALVGGSDKTVSLQPVSIEGNSGLNVAAGVAELSLQYTP